MAKSTKRSRAKSALKNMKIWVIFFAVPIVILDGIGLFILKGYLTIFENGSFWLFDWAGCLPFNLCN